MKRSIIILFVFLMKFAIAQQSFNYPDTIAIVEWASFSGILESNIDSAKTISNWQNAMLDGNFKSFYPNGNIKAIGTFKNNLRIGKWTLYSFNGKNKIILKFKHNGTVKLSRARISGKGGVFLGRGKIYYSYSFFEDNNLTQENTILGKIRYRNSMKNGIAIEYFADGKIRSKTSYRNGKYNGKRTIYCKNGNEKFCASYQKGLPIDKKIEYDCSGNIISSKKINVDNLLPYTLYFDKNDIFLSSKRFIYIDTIFENTKVFFKQDSNNTLFAELNKAFEKGDLSAYSSNSLENLYTPKHNKPDLSGLNIEDGNFKNIRGVIVREDEMFNMQTFLIYKLPLLLQPISEYFINNKNTFLGGPWLYLPQLRKEVDNSKYNFAFFKSLSFPYIYLNNHETAKYSITNIANEHLQSVELEHDLWLIFYGLKPSKPFELQF